MAIKNHEKIFLFLRHRAAATAPKVGYFKRRKMLRLLRDVETPELINKANGFLCLRISDLVLKGPYFMSFMRYQWAGCVLNRWIGDIIEDKGLLGIYLASKGFDGLWDPDMNETIGRQRWPLRMILVRALIEELEQKD